MNVKTALLNQIRQQNPEMADLKATQIVNFILRAFLEGGKYTFSMERAKEGT